MHRFILILTAIMFLANTFIVSAWAKPCVNMNMAPKNVQSMEMAVIDTPCPMMNEQKNEQDKAEKEQDIPSKHCEGVCLCLHASVHQIPIIGQSDVWNNAIGQSHFTLANRQLYVPQSITPPHEPPKTIS